MPKRTDANQNLIVRELRRAGAFCQSMASIGKGCPDILCAHRGQWYVFEVKDGTARPDKQRLTPLEKQWHQLAEATGAKVHVVKSVEDALWVIGVMSIKGMGATRSKVECR